MKKHHLRQVTDRHIGFLGNATTRWLVFTRNKTKQGRFARSILTHQGYPFLPVDEERDIVQHRAGRELHRYVINCQHSVRIVFYSVRAIELALRSSPKQNLQITITIYSNSALK